MTASLKVGHSEESPSRASNLFEMEMTNCSCIAGFFSDATEYLGVLGFALVVLSFSNRVAMSIR